MSSTTTSTRERALSLLGQGIPPSAVASALGVDPSAISQLMSDSDFAEKVTDAKFTTLSKYNEHDSSIDALESKILEKMKDTLPYMTKPLELLKSFQILNSAKRKGSLAPESVTTKQTIVQLILPEITMQRFQSNVHNQVIQVGEQSLLTIPSNRLLALTEAQNVSTRIEGLPNTTTTETARTE
jgi:hypothetical protein